MSSSSFPSEIAITTEQLFPLAVPPPGNISDNEFVRRLLRRGPPSPRTTVNTLTAHGAGLSSEVAVSLAQAAAQVAVERTEAADVRIRAVQRQSEQALLATQTALFSADAALTTLKERVRELEEQQGEGDVTAPTSDSHCPDDFEPNHGLVPDFYVNVDGCRELVRYVRRIPGTGLVQGVLGGTFHTIYVHELQALPSLISDSEPDVIPFWFIRCISANAPSYPLVAAETARLGDWGLEAEIDRYHNLDTQLADIQSQLRELQAAEDNIQMRKRACYFRLTRSDVGERLASLEGLDMAAQHGNDDSPIRRFKGKGRGRPSV
jgi:hypothetical protein